MADLDLRLVETGRVVVDSVGEARLRARLGLASNQDLVLLRFDGGEDLWEILAELYPQPFRGWDSLRVDGWAYWRGAEHQVGYRIVLSSNEGARRYWDLESGYTLMDSVYDKVVGHVPNALSLPLLLDKMVTLLKEGGLG